MSGADLSAGVVAHLGWGVAACPRADEASVRAVAGETAPDELVSRVVAVVAECLAVEVDWSALSLADAGRVAAARVARSHPELDEPALDALAWAFTYSWR